MKKNFVVDEENIWIKKMAKKYGIPVEALKRILKGINFACIVTKE